MTLKLHQKPTSSTKTLALLCLPCHPALSCMLVCLSAFPISPSSPQTLPFINWDIPDLFLDCLTPCTGCSSRTSPKSRSQLLSISRTTETGWLIRLLPGKAANGARGWGPLLKIYFHDASHLQL